MKTNYLLKTKIICKKLEEEILLFVKITNIILLEED